MVIILFIPIVAFLLSFIMFRPSLALSNRVGAIDFPSERKIHSQPMARAGGFSFFVSFSVCLLVSPTDPLLKSPLILGSGIVFLVGFLDDTVNLSPFIKLSGQFLALAVYHFSSELIGNEIPTFSAILISIWVIFITNAVNIIDGLDGLAGGVCCSQALCLVAISLIWGNKSILLCSLILLAAIMGFLPHNFPRAKIFMGDCGALFLGFALAIFSSKLIIDSKSIFCLLAILLIFCVPSYDTIFSFTRRIIKGKNPFRADRGHLHHRLLSCGFSKECATLMLVTISLLFGLLGIIISVI